jgi:hypothetical protein
MDGYPSGHGDELADFLAGMQITNGISMADKKKKTGNGMHCLTAQVISYFKPHFGVGGIYIHPAGTRDAGEDYLYEVNGKTGEEPTIIIKEVHGWEETRKELVLCEGPASKVKEWIAQQE